MAAVTTFINGRFLTQHTSGVQRFAQETVKALDAVLRDEGSAEEWVLLVPPGAHGSLALDVITPCVVGSRSGHVWEQLDLAWHARGGRLVNLANSGPVLHRRSLTVIHDAMIYRTPENFSRAYRLLHQTLGRVLARTSRIGTVSEFSRDELTQVLGLKSVFIIPNSCEHVTAVTPDPDVVGRLGLVPKWYLLFVGSPTPNKNLASAIAAVRSLGPGAPKFVVVGAAQKSVFSAEAASDDDRVIFAGRLADAEIAALYRDAQALVFPSLYEGFGIPPLEAMIQGCPVLSSDIRPVREVCADAAVYFDARDPAAIAAAIGQFAADDTLRAEMIRRGTARAALFSWKRSAQALRAAVAALS